MTGVQTCALPISDGTPQADQRLSRVLNSDPAMGVFRHADAGYEIAEKVASKSHLNIPMRSK